MNLGDRLRLAAVKELEAENLRLRDEIDRLRALMDVMSDDCAETIDLTDRTGVLARA